MANLYIITGPSGVGKSTISKRISNLKAKSALIEGDSFIIKLLVDMFQLGKKVII